MSISRLPSDAIVTSVNSVTATAWSNNFSTLDTGSMFTSSAQISSNGEFYYSVYQTEEAEETQFNLTYCDMVGSGSTLYNSADSEYHSPSKSNYYRYQNLLIGEESDTNILNLLDTSTESEYFYVISIERARYKEKILVGSLELTLGGIVLTDDSSASDPTFIGTGTRKYNIVSGSYGDPDVDDIYGWLIPDMGLILLDGVKLDSAGGVNLGTGRNSDTDDENCEKLFDSITEFRLNSEETLASEFIFVRIKNTEANYSTNPTFIDSDGELKYTSFHYNPKTYITSVGLYNDNGELLAVAKLSAPLLKDFNREALLRIRLDF